MGIGKFLKKAAGISTAKKLLKADPITSKVLKKDPIARKTLSMDPIGKRVLGAGKSRSSILPGEPDPSGRPGRAGRAGYEMHNNKGVPVAKRPMNKMNKLAGLNRKGRFNP